MTWEDVEQFSNRYRLREASAIAFCVFSGLLFVGTHLPDPPDVEVADFRPSDKLQHFVGYAVFTLLLLATMSIWRPPLWRRIGGIGLQSVATLMVVCCCGLLDELTQPYFGRTCSMWDLAADVSGAALALSLFSGLSLSASIARRFRWSRYEPLDMSR